ncbi:hypothetical protein AGR6A_Cc80299 [Agrobacterium sp. NCPPB 925]|nr:hypothetical protein AGR6A_Cc80299 [Agrobacterium sp. NCPPB 925]
MEASFRSGYHRAAWAVRLEYSGTPVRGVQRPLWTGIFLSRHTGLEPVSSRRASARREKFLQPKDLGWLDSGSGPE